MKRLGMTHKAIIKCCAYSEMEGSYLTVQNPWKQVDAGDIRKGLRTIASILKDLGCKILLGHSSIVSFMCASFLLRLACLL